LGFSLANKAGVTASVIHIFNHAVIKGGMFMALGCVALRLGGTDLRHLRGLGKRMPLTMAAFTAGGLGLIGMPMTSGFVSKWYLVQGALDAGLWWVAFVVLGGSLLALVYIWRVVEAIYFQQPEVTPEGGVREAPLSMLIPTWILIGASLYFGIDATLTANSAETAAMMLLGGFQ
jgi:multicomponent Na+:H+ antiporter subunit D